MRRRDALRTGGAALAGLLLAVPLPASRTVEIRLVQDRATGRVGFDPAGVLIEPGTRVRWVNTSGVHTVTAYHPDHGGRALRIPESAQPWDSGYLKAPGETFERRLEAPGVYDYFCRPHERAGMAGRLVVGTATGPGARSWGWWQGSHDWRPVPRAVRAAMPSAEAILSQGQVGL